MRRRDFLRSAGAWSAGVLLGGARGRLVHGQTAAVERWRTFEITTHVHVQHAAGTTRVWLPTPLAVAPYQRTLGDTYQIDGGSVSMIERDGIDVLAAEWPDGADPILTLTSRVATTDHAVDFATPTVPPPRDFSAFSGYLRAMKIPPLDEAKVKSTAALVTRGAGTDLDRARAIFDWSVAQTFSGPIHHDPASQDPNALFVGLARAAGVPARLVYGLRVSQSDATRAQFDRAEAYLVGYGWTPIDARERRFGSWEMHWIAYNAAQDLVLPGSTSGTIRYFMHPQGETARRRIDSLDPEGFRYTIVATEV